ncbi:hypothetical protein NUM3379_26790 [Kineococcus sp. NUM-3379]
MTAARPRAGSTWAGRARAGCACALVALLAWVVVAVLGESAAVPGLGPGAVPLSLGGRPSSALVSAVQAVAVLAATAGTWLMLAAVARGWRPPARRVLAAGALAAGVLVLVPPVGSADHLSYAAYGRIAALGADPYVVAPEDFRGASGAADPVVSAVRAPWEDTVAVYGPVATALLAGISAVAGESVARTVWLWQLVVAASWLAAAAGLHVALRGREAARARAAVLWTLNPLLLGVGVLGAHLDVVAGAAALGCLLLAWRRPLVAGLLLGAAVGSKLPYGAVGAGLLWAWWRSGGPAGGWAGSTGTRRRGRCAGDAPVSRDATGGTSRLRGTPPPRPAREPGFGARHVLAGLAGALLVLVPAHVWAGAHVYDQVRAAGRFVSLATVWRPPVEAGYPRGLLLPGVLVLGAVLLAAWWPALLARRPLLGEALPGRAPGGEVVRHAAPATVALVLVYLLAGPYVLPWYDALLWGPLVLLAPSWLDRLLVVRAGVLALAYVPGLVEGMSPAVEALTLGFRREVGPWAAWAVLVVAVAGAVLARRRELDQAL